MSPTIVHSVSGTSSSNGLPVPFLQRSKPARTRALLLSGVWSFWSMSLLARCGSGDRLRHRRRARTSIVFALLRIAEPAFALEVIDTAFGVDPHHLVARARHVGRAARVLGKKSIINVLTGAGHATVICSATWQSSLDLAGWRAAMKLFRCQSCGQVLYFENTVCERCSHRLGYLPDIGRCRRCSRTTRVADAGTPAPHRAVLRERHIRRLQLARRPDSTAPSASPAATTEPSPTSRSRTMRSAGAHGAGQAPAVLHAAATRPADAADRRPRTGGSPSTS